MNSKYVYIVRTCIITNRSPQEPFRRFSRGEMDQKIYANSLKEACRINLRSSGLRFFLSFDFIPRKSDIGFSTEFKHALSIKNWTILRHRPSLFLIMEYQIPVEIIANRNTTNKKIIMIIVLEPLSKTILEKLYNDNKIPITLEDIAGDTF